MAGKGRLAALASADDERAIFAVRVPCSAGELLQSLGLSRPGRAEAFAGRRLARNGVAIAAGTGLSSGDVVTLALAPGGGAAPRGIQAPARIVFEDPFMLAADKPAGIIVHGDGTGRETLTDRVRAHLLAEGRPHAAACAQAVQRLDEDTTGLVLFSLTRDFQPALDALVAGHGLRKRYLAVVRGSFPTGPCAIEAPIARDRHDARRMRVGKTGKPAHTRVVRLDARKGLSLVACELDTGRRHQIRVHLASTGHPIAGDGLYGGGRSAGGLMLHALEEEFPHPVTGEHLLLRTVWPARFSSLFPRRDIDWTVL